MSTLFFTSHKNRSTVRSFIFLNLVLAALLWTSRPVRAGEFIAVHGDVREQRSIALLQALATSQDEPRLRCTSPIRVDSQQSQSRPGQLLLAAAPELPGIQLQADYWRLQYWCGWQQQAALRHQAVQNWRRHWPHVPIQTVHGNNVSGTALVWLSTVQVLQLPAFSDHRHALLAHWQQGEDGALYRRLQPETLPELARIAGLAPIPVAPSGQLALSQPRPAKAVHAR